MGKKLNLDNPQTFNEKLQWLKLNDRKPQYTLMVDKYAVKDYVKNKIGEEYIIPTYGVWNNFDEINFEKLPDNFVLKCNHDSGSVIVCKSKKLLDIKKARKKMNRALKRNYYKAYREWPYKNIKPKIFAEKFLEDGNNCLMVYKFLCFNGEAKIIQVIQNDKTADECINYYDTNWQLLSLKQNYPNATNDIKPPQKLQQMIKLSNKLSKGFPFLRVDWYETFGVVKFSEFTFYSDAGFAKFEPEEWDLKLGEMIKLPEKTK